MYPLVDGLDDAPLPPNQPPCALTPLGSFALSLVVALETVADMSLIARVEYGRALAHGLPPPRGAGVLGDQDDCLPLAES
jgi:hypothetical protein